MYYQGDRFSRENRYYYGMGNVGKIYQTSNDDYYAELIDCYSFKNVVPIYADTGYVESIDYQTVRKSQNPPWQSSVRPLSEAAMKYIIKKAGTLIPESNGCLQIKLENQLKNSIKQYYRAGDITALNDIILEATQHAGLLGALSNNDEEK
ncbi:hypothetical protein LJB90_02340 [Eubacteriales bacterium OttesenSCG-928-G02]|nr:hypothetical protein [Eubacteriales bacterium OttesenSCG-928-G02]